MLDCQRVVYSIDGRSSCWCCCWWWWWQHSLWWWFDDIGGVALGITSPPKSRGHAPTPGRWIQDGPHASEGAEQNPCCHPSSSTALPKYGEHYWMAQINTAIVINVTFICRWNLFKLFTNTCVKSVIVNVNVLWNNNALQISRFNLISFFNPELYDSLISFIIKWFPPSIYSAN